jgi:IS605 OrfB family transposase
MHSPEAYKALPAKVSQQILLVLDRNWKSFFEALKAYEDDPSQFCGRRKLPWYKHKTEGRNILIYTVQAISKRGLKRGLIQPSRLSISIKTKQGTLILGKNPLWKPECGMGRKNNQNFVSIPHGRFIDMITYKAALVGIQVEVREESYTSKASFLDLDPLPDYQPNHEEEHIFSGRRIGRRNRLYRTKDGRKICAASNGAYNSVRKSRPHAFAKGIAGYVVHPVRLAV